MGHSKTMANCYYVSHNQMVAMLAESCFDKSMLYGIRWMKNSMVAMLVGFLLCWKP